MSLNDKLLSQAQNAGAVEDHSQESKGGFGPRNPEEGVAFARFIGYVELGKQPREYNGEAKDPAKLCNLTFEVYGKKNRDEYEVDGKKETSYRVLRVSNLLVSNSAKSKFRKLFLDMTYGRDIKNMAEMLGEVFKIRIKHSESNGRTYANLVTIGGPFKEEEDEDGEIAEVDVSNKFKPTKRSLQLFLTKSPTLEMWDSIFIDGEREITEEVDGEKVKSTVTNNFLQETIMSSIDWDGSPMQALLAGMDEDEPEEEEETEEELDVEDIDLDEDDEEEVEEEPKKKAKKPAAAKKKKSASTATKSPTKKKAKKAEPEEELDEDEMIDELFDEDDE
jgi:hypothetical protein